MASFKAYEKRFEVDEGDNCIPNSFQDLESAANYISECKNRCVGDGYDEYYRNKNYSVVVVEVTKRKIPPEELGV